MRLPSTLAALAATLLGLQGACAPGTSTTGGAATTGGATTTAVQAAAADPDVAPVGATGLPAGYQGRTDNPNASLADVRYVVSGNGWEVTTGPAHILYRPEDMATGSYTVSSTITQLSRPRHPEAFGIFVGGSDLQGPNQTYTYFLVRGTGEMFAQRRTGSTLDRLIAWHRSQWVPEADAEGRQTYNLEVRVDADSVRFRVNGVQTAALAKAGLSADGIAGLRINHNLQLHATPLRVARE